MGTLRRMHSSSLFEFVQFSSCSFWVCTMVKASHFFCNVEIPSPTLPKTNIFPESRPSQKEHFIFQLIFRVKLLVAGRVHPWRLKSNIIPWRFGSDHFPFFSWVICRFHPPALIFQGLSIFQQCFHIENKVISLEFWSCKFHRNLVTFHVSESYDSLGGT